MLTADETTGGGSTPSEVFEQTTSSLLSRAEVLQLIGDINTHRQTILKSIGNERDVGVKAQLRESMCVFSDTIIKIASAYLCKLEVERVSDLCERSLNSACEKMLKTCDALNETVSTNLSNGTRSFADVASIPARSSNNKVILNHG